MKVLLLIKWKFSLDCQISIQYFWEIAIKVSTKVVDTNDRTCWDVLIKSYLLKTLRSPQKNVGINSDWDLDSMKVLPFIKWQLWRQLAFRNWPNHWMSQPSIFRTLDQTLFLLDLMVSTKRNVGIDSDWDLGSIKVLT